MSSPIVFFDIAGHDDQQLRTFYSKIFGWEFDEASQFTVNVVTPLGAAVRKDPTEKRIYIGVTDINESLSLVEEYGGSVDQSRFEVPGVVILGLFRDPAGNEMGLVEMEGDKPKIP